MSKTLKAKGRKILANKADSNVPVINPMNYVYSLTKALNYYRAEVDDKNKKQWALKYWKSIGKDISKLSAVKESYFSTAGAIAHLALNSAYLEDKDLIKLDNAYDKILSYVTSESKEDEPIVEKKTVQENIEEAASKHIGEIEGLFDDAVFKMKDVSIKDYVSKNSLKPPVIKKIYDWFSAKQKEYKDVINDNELINGYGGKRFVNRMLSVITNIVDDLQTSLQISKVTRAPRKRKPQPPSKIVSKMKWLKEFPDLKLKSEFPEKIIHSNEVWLYDTVKRRIIKYVAQDGYTLTVKGTSILNWDPEKSGSKIIRKPEQITNVQSMSKRPINNFFNEIKATIGKVTGRVNENQLILKVF